MDYTALAITLISAFGLFALMVSMFLISLVRSMYQSTQNALRDAATYRTRNARLNDALEKAIGETQNLKIQISALHGETKKIILRQDEEIKAAYNRGGLDVENKLKIKSN